MKNFDWTSFTRKIAVKASLSNMYNAWTKKKEIEKWFLKEATYFDAGKNKTDASLNIQKGQTYQWSWHTYDGIEQGKITEANGRDFIQFSFAGETLVEIKLTRQNEFTLVELTQKNIPTDDESKKNIRLDCDRGWSFYLVNLKSVYEGGIDLRNKNKELKGVVNS